MLAAGGTGGHLFPAFALAEELRRRGVAVDLMTDMRGDRYGSGFPARAIYQVPSATLASRTPARCRQNDGCSRARHQGGIHDPEAGEAECRHRVWRLSDLSATRRGASQAHSDGGARAERRARACQQDARQARHGDRDVVRAHEISRRQACAQGSADGKSRAPGGHRCGDARLRRARPRWRRSHSDFRRQPGGTLFRGLRAAGAVCACPTSCASAFASCSRRARKMWSGCARLTPKPVSAPISRRSSLTFRRGWRQRISSSRGPALRPSRSSPSSGVRRSWCRCRMPSTTTSSTTPGVLPNQVVRWCIEQRNLSPERLADEIEKLLAAPDTLAAAAEAAKTAGRADAVRRLADFTLALADGHRPAARVPTNMRL